MKCKQGATGQTEEREGQTSVSMHDLPQFEMSDLEIADPFLSHLLFLKNLSF